jgi:hypothetical protein
MAGGGGKNTTKSNSNTVSNSVTHEDKTTNSLPAEWAAQPLKDITAKATDIYGNGSLSPDITNAWDQIRGLTSQPNPFRDATVGGITNLAQSGGLNQEQNNQITGLNTHINNGLYKLKQELKAPTFAEQNLSQYANGSLLGGSGNQYLDPIIAKANQDAMQKVNGMYAGAGRIGGGANAMDLARAMSETENNLRYNDYSQQVQNQFNANKLIDDEKFQRQQGRAAIIGEQAGIRGQIANIAQQGNQNMLGMTALNPMIDNLRYAGADRLLNLGSAEQAAPYENLNNYLALVRGASNGYGSQHTVGTSTTQGNSQTQGSQTSPGQSPLQQIAGVGMMAGGKGK